MIRRWLRQFAAGMGLGSLGYLYGIFLQEKQSALKSLRAGTQVIAVDGGEIEYSMQGQGTPVVFIHGGMGGYEQGVALRDIFNLDQVQFISISRPGHRRTSLSLGQTPAQQATVVRKLLDQLGIESAYVMALSAGGLTALQFAIDHADKCRGLVLLSAHGPTLKNFQPPPYFLWLLDFMMRSDFFLWMLLRAAMWGLLRLLGTSNAQIQSHFQKFRDVFSGVFPGSDWRAGTMNDLKQILALPPMALESIHVPTLVIHGTSDNIVAYAVAADSASRIPNAQLISIDKGTHLIMATHSDEISKAFKDFIG